MLVAVSLANGGPGLACLSEALYNYLCFGAQCHITPDLSMISDFTVQECLEEVSLYMYDVLLHYAIFHIYTMPYIYIQGK